MHEKKSAFISIKDFGSAGKLISQIKKLWKDRDFRKALEQKIQGPAFERAGALLIKQLATEGGK
ncbi:MAG: hypothetical protein ABH874_00520 [Methanobacteriota archaeon]